MEDTDLIWRNLHFCYECGNSVLTWDWSSKWQLSHTAAANLYSTQGEKFSSDLISSPTAIFQLTNINLRWSQKSNWLTPGSNHISDTDICNLGLICQIISSCSYHSFEQKKVIYWTGRGILASTRGYIQLK